MVKSEMEMTRKKSDDDLRLRKVNGIEESSELSEEELQRRRELAVKMRFASPEILATLLLFPLGLSSGVFTNLLMESLCMEVQNMTSDICSHVEQIPSEVLSEIQPKVNLLLNYKVLIETFVPAFCVIFLGPWSDAHGRRPLILLSLLGQFLYYSILTGLVFFKHLLPASMYLTAAIPVGLTGGYSVFFLAVVCFITDNTTKENRAAKMGTFEAGCMLGSLVAQLLTARVSQGPHGFQVTFMICCVICSINLLYAFLFVPESANLSQNAHQVRLLDLFRAMAKKRENYRRALLYLLIFANTAYILIVFGEGDIYYQSAIKRFHWNLENYSRLNSMSIAIAGLVLVFGTYLVKYLKMSDVTAALVVISPRIYSSLIICWAPTDEWLYVAAALGCICTLITPFYRAAITKLIPSDELGKVFAVIMFTEALVPSVGSNIYTFTYNAVLHTHPNSVFLVSCGFATFSTIMLLFAFIIQRRYPSIDFEQVTGGSTNTVADQID